MCPANITSIWLLALTLAARAAASDYSMLATQRGVSPGRTTYYINPISGNDTNSGLKAGDPWQSFQNVNRLLLSAGDRVEVLAPGPFHQSLAAMGAGISTAPVEIHFAPGRYDFYPADALKLSLNISNDNDTPSTPKAIAMLFKDIRHLRVIGTNTDIYIRGKMIETMLDHAENVSFEGLAFDYQRPTVSEFTVMQVGSNWAEVQVHPDSTYNLEEGKLVWVGEGWRSHGLDLAQECD
jgi:hypothetical protein